ncbi:unnamed protein product [Camellia sinensis]
MVEVLLCLSSDVAMPVLDALISIGGSIGGKVVELLVEPVGRQFGYVIYRRKYIEDLRDQVKKLEARRKDVEDIIDAAKRNGEEILETVKIWIEKVDGFIEAKKLLEDGTNVNQKCFNGWFPDLVTRHRLGKEAKNKAEEAKELEKNGYFSNSNISKPAPPLGMESVPSERLVAYETTNLAMMNVMQALRDDKINFIGIHGIGGVGKTTLVKEIGKKAKSDKLFDKVVMAVVSQNPDIKKIQDQIAGMLGITKFNQLSDIERTSTLCARLKNVKKILVILDDVWNRLELTTLGIPFGQDHVGCKIIITTRREQVCRTMGNEWEKTKIVWLDVLSEQDSWDLFRKNVGDVVASSALNDVAKEVCKECGGLPIAIVTVAKAMKGKSNLEEWKNAAQELKKSLPTNIEDVNKKVYQILMWSYDYLQDEEAKACFLLCSLFPEDDNILVEDLVRYGMGLRLFKNVDTVQEVRGRAKSVISNLIDSCLLLASDRQDYIKMHDVVRDVAIFIGSKKHFVRADCNLKDWPNMDSLDQYTGISLMRNQISNLPEVLECPKLQILLLQDNGNAWSCSHEFFSRMKALSVLDLSQLGHNFDNLIRSPDAFNNQMCLRTLVLDGIKFGDTKFLGQLKTLEVLSFRHAFFSEAPNAIRELTNLRMLDMTESHHEFLIPATMVLPLFHLEELYLLGITSSSIGYPAVEVVAALRSLPRLKMLTISIPDIADIPKDFVFPELESFIILIGKSSSWVRVENYSPNYLGLANLVGTMVNWSKWLKMVLKRATRLSIEDCSELEYLINTEEWGISSQAQPRDLQLFFNLEELVLYCLDSFKGICAASALTTSSWVFFPKLRRLIVNNCPSLSTVLLPFNLLQWLQHLEELFVIGCVKLERVFDFGSEGEGMKLLSSLRDLTLWKLPRLKHISNCSSRQHVQLGNLRSMKVHSCGKLKYVFQPSIAQALHQLEKLIVFECEEMEEIVAAKQNEGQQEEEEERVGYKMEFKSLKQLYLGRLPNLSGFCTGGDDFPFEWPSLEQLGVIECPKMKTFAATTSGSTPKLKEVEVELDRSVIPLQGMDLNQFVQIHVISKPPN